MFENLLSKRVENYAGNYKSFTFKVNKMTSCIPLFKQATKIFTV